MNTSPKKWKLALHVHLHYTDLLPLMIGYFQNIPYEYDLFITITDAQQSAHVAKLCKSAIPEVRTTIVTVENKGRDVKPFYTDLGVVLLDYDYVCHVHGKKSAHNQGATEGWLEYLLDHLMGSRETVEAIFNQFGENPMTGLIYPPIYNKLPYWVYTWLSNRNYAVKLQQLLQIRQLPDSHFSYPVGNMFWANVAAIRPLLELGLKDSDYPDENKQLDGEIMHALERMISVLTVDRGYDNYIIRKSDQSIKLINALNGIDYTDYYASSIDTLKYIINLPRFKLISFDIFDTLIVRALLSPEDLFDLMQAEFEVISGKKEEFKKVRQAADSYLRSKLTAKTDVTLNAIYKRIQNVLELEEPATERLKQLELHYETKLMTSRASMVEAMNFAYNLGKRVVLTSDMYLSRRHIETILQKLGITNFHEIYLSSEIGLRKDTRTLFPYILEKEHIEQPQQMLHIGDNEHSDLQVPGDLGIGIFHVMRPNELFAKTSLAKEALNKQLLNLSAFSRISLSLAINKAFDDPFPKKNSFVNADLRLFGYFYFGPLILAFVKWVAETARLDGVKKLYFLSRDGEIMYKIYELLQKHSDTPLPEALYLEVSRRSIGVPLIHTKAQLDKLLQRDFFGNSLKDFIEIRLGINLSKHPEVDVRSFGFSAIEEPLHIPEDLEKVKLLAYHLFDTFKVHFEEEKEHALGYLTSRHLMESDKKAIVDIGYSGTMQRMLIDITGKPIHGYYMVLYSSIDSLIGRSDVYAKGLFGHKVDQYSKHLPIDKYSLFYEMILSSVEGPVKNYAAKGRDFFVPQYEPVSPEEEHKLSKLPLIHEGILDYCNDFLSLSQGTDLIRWDDKDFLQTPFQFFLENPQQEDVAMLAGYSLDDHYCGNGILYWVPQKTELDSESYDGNKYLWKKKVPNAGLWSDKKGQDKIPHPDPPDYGGFDNRQEYEIFSWYQKEYEVLPRWYKKIGAIFKLLKGTKRIRIVFEDVGYPKVFHSKAEEIQAWYNKEYEVLPLWYKRFGHLVQVAKGKKKLKDLL